MRKNLFQSKIDSILFNFFFSTFLGWTAAVGGILNHGERVRLRIEDVVACKDFRKMVWMDLLGDVRRRRRRRRVACRLAGWLS